MKHRWTFSPGGAIWRVHPAVNGRFVGEARDLEARRASFFAVDAYTGKALWRGLGIDESWWVGMEAVRGDVLYVHGYANPTLPIHRGLSAIDTATGTILRTNSAWLQGMPLDPDAGDTGDDWQTTVLFPTPMDLDALADGPLGNLLFRLHPAGGYVGPVEVVEEGVLSVVAATERSGRENTPRLRHVLRVLDRPGGRELFHDVLLQDAQGVLTDAFFVQQGLLVYVKERRELCAVELSPAARPLS